MLRKKSLQVEEELMSRGCNRCSISLNPATTEPYCGDCQNVADARDILEKLFESIKRMSLSPDDKAVLMEQVSTAHNHLLDPEFSTAQRRWLSIPDDQE